MRFIAPIVEGHGEVDAVPILIRRILGNDVKVNPPIRINVASFLHDHEYFLKYISLAAGKAAQSSQGGVLILMDCEDKCPGILGPELLSKARTAGNDVPILVALAYREYETWFMAAAESLRGLHGLPKDLSPPSDVEKTRDAKGWLKKHMDKKKPYDPIVHQSKFTRTFDIEQACSNHSFNRFRQRLITFPPL
ncbi:MAG: DUF4276 family protein [Alphaproteobacteria bacterium]